MKSILAEKCKGRPKDDSLPKLSQFNKEDATRSTYVRFLLSLKVLFIINLFIGPYVSNPEKNSVN